MVRMRRSSTHLGGCVGRRVVTLAAFAFMVLCHPVSAAFEPTCSAAKVKAQGLAMTKVLTCYAKQVKAAGYVSDFRCLGVNQLAITSAFAKADAGGGCDGDSYGAAAVMAAGADQLTAALAPLGLGLDEVKCAAAKLRTAGRVALKHLKCFVKAAHKRAPVDPACRFAARARLATRFVTEEAKGHCRTVADFGAIDTLIDRFVVDALTETAPRLIPRLCCQLSATVALVPPVSVRACADVIELGCTAPATLFDALGASAVAVPGAVCNGDGLCQAVRVSTATCCAAVSNADPSLRSCAESGSPVFAACESFNGLQSAVTFTAHPGRNCVNHYPDPPSCDQP